LKRFVLRCAALASLTLSTFTFADPVALQPGDRVAICGDSITEQKQYSAFVEQYLLACKPKADLKAAQFGWGGERVPGFNARVTSDVAWFAPTVATTCYGMNDGGYNAITETIAKTYRDGTVQMVKNLKDAGVRAIVIGSPGVVDTDTYKRPSGGADVYNKTLGQLRDIAKEVAASEGVGFADVHAAMLDAMAKFKEKFPGQPFAGKDGVHPGANGHLAMAYAFLKALGCDGEIGTITVDLSGNKAEATEGHKVLSATDGTVEVESTRYPFVTAGKSDDPGSARAAAAFVPFDEELNRFKLVVTGATGKTKVTWGDVSKEFDADALAKGINLAAEFPDNPFGPAFAKVAAVVKEQQEFETPAVKQLLHSAPTYKKILPDDAAAVDQLVASAVKRDAALLDASVKSVEPVKHVIKIEAVK
jgi:lysophospholipase L1-like esterase